MYPFIFTLAGLSLLVLFWMRRKRATLSSFHAQSISRPLHISETVIVVATLVGTVGALFLVFRHYGLLLLNVDRMTVIRTAFVFLAIIAFGLFDQARWKDVRDRYKYFYAFVLGTIVSWILIAFKRAFLETGFGQDPFLMSAGIVCVLIGWRFLFGPWSASIKSTVLGTFVFWASYALLRDESRADLIATCIAIFAAMIPVIVWCWLFLSYHRQRLSVVILAFFAGMLSTVPILFYDVLTRHGIEFNFFLFRIVPENFSGSSTVFVQQSFLQGQAGMLSTTISITLVTYLLVGAIEELSKYWVLRYSSTQFFRSIDDVLQLSIVVAIGFAFAENLANPNYYVGFVQTYLLNDATRSFSALFANILGRAVLTNMVHIFSTGIMGYFVGVAYFASPILREEFAREKVHTILLVFHQLFALPSDALYARYKILQGILSAIALHACFDFIVSLPDILPGNPNTLGAVFGMSPSSFFSHIPLTLPPSVFYVLGGLWLLLSLFEKQEDMKEYGTIVQTQTIVS